MAQAKTVASADPASSLVISPQVLNSEADGFNRLWVPTGSRYQMAHVKEVIAALSLGGKTLVRYICYLK